MFRKPFIALIFSIGLLIVGQGAAFAQTAPVSGTVEMVKEDGTRVPVAGATVEALRTDIKSSSPPSKTNKNGGFNFAGLQLGWTFILSVSGPGIAPTYLSNIKPGQDKIVITVTPGDGSKLPEDEVRKGVANAKASTGNTAVPTEDQKKAAAEYEAKVKEIKEKNERATKTNEVVTRALKEGNDAFSAKNYDLAVTKYDEGYNADPQFLGSAPVFLNNRGTALLSRAVDTYNKGIKAPDVSEKIANLGAAKKDLAEAADGYLKAWTLLKNAQPADIPDKANFDQAKAATLRGARDIFRMAVKTEQVDPSVIEAAKVLIPEYIATETETAKKAEANLIFADLYRVVGDSDNAIAAYKKILETSPDDLDALAGAGLSLVNLGYINNEKTKLQEGSNFLQKFASAAPDTHKFKADAVALIDTLKKEQNVTPQKTTTTKKKP
jgi:tetratricopeptide (TPR) repeat protein